MVYLKDDGSLDIERINNLPIEEHCKCGCIFNKKTNEGIFIKTTNKRV